MSEEKQPEAKLPPGFFIPIGVAIGAGLGSALGNLALGTGIGVGLGGVMTLVQTRGVFGGGSAEDE